MFASDPIARHVDAELLPGRDVQTDDELISYSKLMPVMPSANTMAPTLVMLVFGTKKLRNAGNDLGGAVRGFKDGMRDSAASPAINDKQ